MSSSTHEEWYLRAAKEWYESQRAKTGKINTNVMNAGLIVSHMVSEGLPIDDEHLYSEGKSQVRGLSGGTIQKILEQNGETRFFTSEGGRTSRGTVHLAASFRDTLNKLNPTYEKPQDMRKVSSELEAFFTACVRIDYFDKQRISVDIDPLKPVSFLVTEILKAAADRSDKPTGIVLQHLVGAKLQLRFPDEKIGLDRANTADRQTDREGDFQVGNTAFHVTTAPMEKLVSRCVKNKNEGYRPVILTLESKVQAAKQMAENVNMLDQISVQSAEIFIGTNIEEISIYDGDKIKVSIAQLIRTYNSRINRIESDKSLMIEEPKWVERILSH
ncbi:DUF4928 family protein [Photorhabdus sp. APURE]|uniref:DUF4928 family protein n=1 Tax=Photorhabdus aballayi TaxID=2991723 RepID=UPI00223D1DA1|nr:DUF4928 family protein [Photorhabdus aballayi]MCW7550121.1 DUF4928 family protein [Photorhabdus aballayi]